MGSQYWGLDEDPEEALNLFTGLLEKFTVVNSGRPPLHSGTELLRRGHR